MVKRILPSIVFALIGVSAWYVHPTQLAAFCSGVAIALLFATILNEIYRSR